MTSSTAVFREHDVMPAQVRSAVFGRIISDWVMLNSHRTVRGDVAAWGRAEPILTGYVRPADVVDAIDASDLAGKDDLLLALLRLMHRGDQVAGQTLLHAMLPVLAKEAAGPPYMPGEGAEDKRARVLAAFWEVAASYPIARRPQKVAANLQWDTRATARPTMFPETPQAPEALPEPSPAEAPDIDGAEVVTWALRRRVINSREAALLMATYLPDETTARVEGLSRRTVQRRNRETQDKIKRAWLAEFCHA